MGAESIYLSVIVIGELTKGAMLLPRGKRRTELLQWIESLLHAYSGRILPVDLDVASRWGKVMAETRRSGITLNPADALIAATALHHGLHLVTRNEKVFVHTGVKIINPWS